MLYLCRSINSCVFAYTESNKITLILIDYQSLDSKPWFNYQVQKMCSVAASIATMAFSKIFTGNINDRRKALAKDGVRFFEDSFISHVIAEEQGVIFDARCFNIPKEEVANFIYWRQSRAVRRSIERVGKTYFTEEQLRHVVYGSIKDMLLKEYNIDWHDYPTSCKHGSACVMRPNESIPGSLMWVIDDEMPIIKGESRAYVNDAIMFNESLEVFDENELQHFLGYPYDAGYSVRKRSDKKEGKDS